MPKTVRNFWIDLAVDGQKEIGRGPRDADGGFDLKIGVRQIGRISKWSLSVKGTALENGTLELKVTRYYGDIMPEELVTIAVTR